MFYKVEIDSELISEFCEELENALQDVEGIIISLENLAYNDVSLKTIKQTFHSLWISTTKLQLIPMSESLDDLIKALDKLIQFKVYPSKTSEYLLLLIDRILFLAKEVERNLLISIQETQHILVSLQYIILANDPDAVNEGVEQALYAITQNISTNADENPADLNIDLFSDTESTERTTEFFTDNEPVDANIELFTDSEPSENNHTQAPAVCNSNNPQAYAMDFISALKKSEAIMLLAGIADKATSNDHSHTEFLLELSLAINFIAGKPIDEEGLAKGILLHDIALSAIPDVINKPKKLTSEEIKLIRMHPSQGVVLGQAMNLPEESLNLIAHHHERLDGKGYPHGFKGDQISDAGKLIGIIDSFHAMVDNRPHKKYQRSPLRAVAEINAGINLHYDKHWIKHFNRYMKEQWLLTQKKCRKSKI
jgi:chemotaxis protein histidine kinase CheA